MALEGEMVDAAPTDAERRIIMSIKCLMNCRLEDVKEKGNGGKERMKVLSLFDGMACGMIAMQLAGVDVES